MTEYQDQIESLKPLLKAIAEQLEFENDPECDTTDDRSFICIENENCFTQFNDLTWGDLKRIYGAWTQ